MNIEDLFNTDLLYYEAQDELISTGMDVVLDT